MCVKANKGSAMRENEEAKQLVKTAREAMKEWKAKAGIKAVLPKTRNQKMEKIKYSKSVRARERHELRKVSLGAASSVRIVKPE